MPSGAGEQTQDALASSCPADWSVSDKHTVEPMPHTLLQSSGYHKRADSGLSHRTGASDFLEQPQKVRKDEKRLWAGKDAVPQGLGFQMENDGKKTRVRPNGR